MKVSDKIKAEQKECSKYGETELEGGKCSECGSVEVEVEVVEPMADEY